MRLREIYDILVDTELSQIHLGQDESKVIGLINLALLDIYARFAILQEEQVITVTEGRTRYSLQDNSQRVLQVYYRNTIEEPLNGNDAFVEVPINDINCDESVFTPQPYVLHIPNAEAGRVYSIIMIVNPPHITKANIDTVDMIVPAQLMEPIVNYVGYRAYKSMNGDDKTDIGSYWRAYERSCNEVLKRGLMNQFIMTNSKLTDRGWA